MIEEEVRKCWVCGNTYIEKRGARAFRKRVCPDCRWRIERYLGRKI